MTNLVIEGARIHNIRTAAGFLQKGLPLSSDTPEELRIAALQALQFGAQPTDEQLRTLLPGMDKIVQQRSNP